MKILSAEEIRKADAHTIDHEPVTSIDLMERAAVACYLWITKHIDKFSSIKVFCGLGNNGADGLAIARMLCRADYNVQVYVVHFSMKKSPDFSINEKRLNDHSPNVMMNILDENNIPALTEKDTVIDAIFGTGLNKPPEGLSAAIIRHINESGAGVVAIDMPSGLFADVHSDKTNAVMKATYTLSFQVPKLAFMFPENHPFVGEWVILDIGLDLSFIDELPGLGFIIDDEMIRSFLKPRTKFSHKGIYGHALLIAGSYGKIGAVILASKACLRSGVGLLTVHVPACGYEIMQESVPEAMVQVDPDERIVTSGVILENISAVAIGCGIGTGKKTMEACSELFSSCKVPLVVDADAINLIGLNTELLKLLPEKAILTPHPKEFGRIAGEVENDFHRHKSQVEFARTHNVYVVLKGAHTCIACPDGTVYFNSTGNPGMSKGGSGDALTGIVVSFLAQGYSQKQASILGVYVHGLAGDLAAKKLTQQAMLPTDLIDHLGEVFQLLYD